MISETDHDPPPNYRSWKCGSCGDGVESIEIKETSIITYRLALTGESGFRWEQADVEPVEKDAEEPVFRCGECGTAITAGDGKIIRTAVELERYLDDAVIQMEALEPLERLAAEPEGSEGIA